MKEVFGILAITIGLIAAVPYIYGIVTKKTQPHRISWAIWGLLALVTLTSYLSNGAKWSALLAVAAAFNNAVIFVLAMKYGVGGTSLMDKIILCIGVLGVILWAVTQQAAYGLLFALGADLLGAILTTIKAYKKPYSESALAWGLAFTASLCGLLAVHTYTFTQTVYPAYAMTTGLVFTGVTCVRRILINKTLPGAK